MGEIVALMELENTVDRDNASDGLCDESAVRRTTVEGVVDTGAVMLVLPEDVVGHLGLRTRREVMVAYANEYRETRQVAGAGDGADRQPLHERRLHHRAAIERAADRPDRTGSTGPSRGLRQSHAGAAPGIAGHPLAETEMSRSPAASP